MKNYNEFLKNTANDYKISLDDNMLQRFEKYSELLVEWNQKMNLTAITEPEEIAIKHFLDSLLLLCAFDIKKGDSVIDVGTGAGFPGVPIKIARPDLNLTLLDSLNKRLVFLDNLMKNLNLDANLVHLRAEDGSRKEEFREKFSIATSRAVAALPALLEYCMPYVKVGGVFIAMKGPLIDEEIENSQNAIDTLGGKIEDIKKFVLPDNSTRNILIIKKIKKVSSKYPRRGVKISKNPL